MRKIVFIISSCLFLLASFGSYFSAFSVDTPVVTKNKKIILAEKNPIADILCKGLRAVSNTIAKAIMVFLMIVTGLGFLLGKVSWGILIAILIGIGVIFGTEKIVGAMVGVGGEGGGTAKRACDCKFGAC